MSEVQTHVPFMQLLYDGLTTPDSIDDFVEQWHTSEGLGVHAPSLRDFLGLTQEEYGRWVRDHRALADILKERRAQRTARA